MKLVNVNSVMKNLKTKIMEKIEVTMQEIWQATRPIIYKNKKKYSRKDKQKT